jgi:glycosyltransferase involved in cell wall biosynthesis
MDTGFERAPRIVHLTSAHPWDDPRIFHKMCRWLARAGAEVHLVAANGLGTEQPEVDGVRLHLLSQPQGRRERMIRTRAAAWRLALSLEPDLVHFHDPELLWGRLWRANPGVRVVYDVHEDLTEQVTLKRWLPRVVRLMGGAIGELEQRLAASAHGIITVDPVLQERFTGRDVPLVRNFPDIAAIDLITPALRPAGSEDRWVAICAGSLGNDRGTGELVRAFDLLIDTFELWLVGDAPASELEEWKQYRGWKRVRHFPRMALGPALAMVKSADVVLNVVPPRAQYRWARYPVKGLEAMVCGIPLVMSDFENLRETFGGAAVFVDPENPQDLAAAMRGLANDPERARKLGEHGRQLVRKRFCWSSEFRVLLDEYARLSPVCRPENFTRITMP